MRRQGTRCEVNEGINQLETIYAILRFSGFAKMQSSILLSRQRLGNPCKNELCGFHCSCFGKNLWFRADFPWNWGQERTDFGGNKGGNSNQTIKNRSRADTDVAFLFTLNHPTFMCSEREE